MYRILKPRHLQKTKQLSTYNPRFTGEQLRYLEVTCVNVPCELVAEASWPRSHVCGPLVSCSCNFTLLFFSFSPRSKKIYVSKYSYFKSVQGQNISNAMGDWQANKSSSRWRRPVSHGKPRIWPAIDRKTQELNHNILGNFYICFAKSIIGSLLKIRKKWTNPKWCMQKVYNLKIEIE